MAYDRDRNVVVLFGRVYNNRDFKDSWELTIKEPT
jgi:hypothetical protein